MIFEIIFSFIAYLILFIISKRFLKFPMKKTEQGYEELTDKAKNSTLLSWASIIQCWIASSSMLYLYFTLDHDFTRGMFYTEELAICIDYGFLLFDIAVHWYNTSLSLFTIWHHVSAIVVYTAMFVYPQGVFLSLFTVGASDLTSPIQISRRIYYTFNEKTNSKMSTLNIFSFGIPFIIIRTFILPQFYYVWFTSLEMALLIKVLSIISFALIIVWSYQVFCLLWKQFPYLFDNKENIERSVVWRKGREIMQTIRKDAGYSMGFNSAIFAITVILPLIISIQHSPIGFN